MAKKIIEKFYSDLSGEEIDASNPTVKFTFDSTSYELDLTESESQALTDSLASYIGAARQVSGNASQRSGPPASEVRAWAIKQGIEIPTKGRIPLEIKAAYDMAH